MNLTETTENFWLTRKAPQASARSWCFLSFKYPFLGWMDWSLNWNISKYLGIAARTPNTGRPRMMRPINFESFPSKPPSCSSPKWPQRAPDTKQGRGWESSCYFCLWGHKIQADLAEFGFELMETGRAESECCSFLLQSFPQLSTQNLRMKIHWFRIPENLIPATADFFCVMHLPPAAFLLFGWVCGLGFFGNISFLWKPMQIP